MRSTGITGGRIEGDPGVELRVVQGYSNDLDGVTMAAPLRIAASTAHIQNGLTLDNAVVTIGDAANGQLQGAHLQFGSGSQTLSGVGEVRFDAVAGGPGSFPFPRINMLESRAARLTIAAGVTVRTSGGDGFLGGYYPNLNAPPARAPMTNHGLLLAENGHRLSLFTADVEQLGTLQADADSTLVIHDDHLVNQGRLATTGGSLQFSNDLTLGRASTLAVELSAELVAPMSTPVAVGEQLVLGGRFEATLAAGFVPTVGDMFPIAAAASLSGAFDAAALPALSPGLYWQIVAGTSTLALEVRTGAPAGDFNFNGASEGGDFLAWQRGESPNPGSTGDLADWQSTFGSAGAAPHGAAIPEPAASALALGMAACLIPRKKSGPSAAVRRRAPR